MNHCAIVAIERILCRICNSDCGNSNSRHSNSIVVLVLETPIKTEAKHSKS